MSREIKFRVWDTEKQEWLAASDPNSLTYYGFHLFGEVMLMQSINLEVLSKIVIEQYTGLKDKNGVEIYESDLIRLYDGATHHIYEVVYSDADTAYTLKAHGRFWSTDTRTILTSVEWDKLSIGYKMSYYSLSAIQEDFEVIGNIHESPELLKAVN